MVSEELSVFGRQIHTHTHIHTHERREENSTKGSVVWYKQHGVQNQNSGFKSVL